MPGSPVALNVIDAAGNLALTQKIFDNFAAARPELVSGFTFNKAPSPELPGKIKDGSNSLQADEWWSGRWKEDFDRAAEAGQNAHRLSIEWSRIQPTPDRWDEDALDQYRQIIRGLVQRGLDLVHRGTGRRHAGGEERLGSSEVVSVEDLFGGVDRKPERLVDQPTV